LELHCSLMQLSMLHGHVGVMTWPEQLIQRLTSIGAQDALILLGASFSAPKVQQLLCCSPSVDNPALQRFDELLRWTVERI